jgi:hypothetical protein
MVLLVPGIVDIVLVSGIALVLAVVVVALVSLAVEAYAQPAAADGPAHSHLHIPHIVPLDWVREHARVLRH